MKIAIYVSGHGYGHAVREGELARALSERGVEVVLVSNADAEAFWPMAPGVELIQAPIDVGVLQPSSLEIDEPGTLAAFARFSERWPELARTEAERIQALAVDLVVADIAPLAILAARLAGKPAVLIANFTWDWIYRAWSDRHPLAGELADRCTLAYRQATLLLALPLSGGLAHGIPTEPVPLLVRPARRTRKELRRELGVSEAQIAVLVAFGGFGPPRLPPPVDVDPGRVRFFGYTDLGWPEPLYRRLDRRCHEHPDLVAAADVLLGKPGYGTVAECSVHDTRMVWLGRARFPEVEVLVQGINDHVGGVELAPEALSRGALGEALARALATTPARGRLAGGGAAAIAGRLIELAQDPT